MTTICFQIPPFNSDDASNETILNSIDEIVLDLSLQVVKINAMCIFYHHLFGNLDQKLFAAVIDLNRKVIFKLSIYLLVPVTIILRYTCSTKKY